MTWKEGTHAHIGQFEYVDKDMFITPFLTTEFCRYLISDFEKCGFNTRGNYDCFLHLIDDGPKHCASFLSLLLKYIEPEIVRAWTTAVKGRLFKAYPVPFCTKFSRDTKSVLHLHNDNSLITLLIKLNNDYTGCNTVYPRQHWGTSQLEVGQMVVLPGTITHPHYTEELRSGMKYSLVGRVSILEPRMGRFDDISQIMSV